MNKREQITASITNDLKREVYEAQRLSRVERDHEFTALISDISNDLKTLAERYEHMLHDYQDDLAHMLPLILTDDDTELTEAQQKYVKGVAHDLEEYIARMLVCVQALQRNDLSNMPASLILLNFQDVAAPCTRIQHMLKTIMPGLPQTPEE